MELVPGVAAGMAVAVPVVKSNKTMSRQSGKTRVLIMKVLLVT